MTQQSARAAWRDPRVLAVAAAMFVVSTQVGALEPSVMFRLSHFGLSAHSQGILWGLSVPAMHGLSTAMVRIERRSLTQCMHYACTRP